MVYLVGAGPSDPKLITERGRELLSRADCVIYDRLVNRALLKKVRASCETIYAGKSADSWGRTQRRINRLLIDRGNRQAVVVRLKGGDPALFGRMSEEIEVLERAGVPYEVVPGVSSVWAAATAAGIPLTDRRFSSSVAFVTGHRAAGTGRSASVRWKELSRGVDTLVILMGRAALSRIVRRLETAGRPATTPVALIRWASDPRQELLVSTLGKVGQELQHRPEFGPPVVMIVGEVVKARHAGSPLSGRKILITRAASDSAQMIRQFREKGARCVHLPMIRIRALRLKAQEKQRLVRELRRADWVLFNSHHAVESVKPLRGNIRGKICAIGPRTESALRKRGLTPDLVPGESSGAGVVRAFSKIPVRGRRVLIPRSNLGIGQEPAAAFRRRGADVQEIAVYETAAVSIPAARLRWALSRADAVTFTSASTARSFLDSLKRAHLPLKKAINGTPVVAIGPSTARELERGGVRRVWTPRESGSLAGLVEAVEQAIQ